MSLTLDVKTIIDQKSNGSQLFMQDYTGDYDAVNNPTGWGDGTTNPARAAVTQITLTITKGDLTYSKVLTGADLTAYLNGPGITINSTVFGTGYTVFEDGLYTIVVKVEGTWAGSPSPYIVYDNRMEYFLWQMWCDIRKLISSVSVPITDYLESYNISLLNILFNDILFLCQYGMPDRATTVYTFLRNTLDNETVLTELFKNFKNYG